MQTGVEEEEGDLRSEEVNYQEMIDAQSEEVDFQEAEWQSQEEEEQPKEYEVFLDIKQSYENSLARHQALVKALQAENRNEKMKRLKY